jgi:hypothetical protein
MLVPGRKQEVAEMPEFDSHDALIYHLICIGRMFFVRASIAATVLPAPGPTGPEKRRLH